MNNKQLLIKSFELVFTQLNYCPLLPPDNRGSFLDHLDQHRTHDLRATHQTHSKLTKVDKIV